MIILFGIRRRTSRLGTAFLLCARCQTPAAQSVNRLRRYFTLFFIPVIPLGTTYVMTCTMCGQSTKISREAAEATLTPVSDTRATLVTAPAMELPAPATAGLEEAAPLSDVGGAEGD